MIDLAAWRLRSQRLSGPPCGSPVEVVRRLTAVQAQDYGGAAWAVAQRTAGSTQREIDALLDAGALLRTHVLRPTWHFVHADDIRWLLDLTGPRILRGLGSRERFLELDEHTIARAKDAFASALSGGRSLTRPELGEVLRREGIAPEGQRLAHLLLAGELESLIVSGPLRGKQHSYMLLEERVPNVRSLQREEALAELARRYFSSHGPAQIQDAMWWSGLPARDLQSGIALAGDTLAHQVVDGKDYWFDANDGPVPPATDVAHLLSNWDEYTVGYRDRSAAMDPGLPFDPSLFAFSSILSNVLTLGGRVRGAWRRTVTGGRIRIDLRLIAPLAPDEAAAVEGEADRMGRFMEQQIELNATSAAVGG